MSSYIFYCYIHHWFFFLLFAQTAVSYIAAIFINKYILKKKGILLCGIGFNLSLLIFFKYFNFFIDNFNTLIQLSGLNFIIPYIAIFLPVGISFYTFQNIGYLVDVYRNDFPPCKNFIDYCLFVSFFPKLIAGPIERSGNLLKQISSNPTTNLDNLVNGCHLMLWGFFKKLVIADNIALIANKIFILKEPDFFLITAGTFAFTIQIFADFSGYTDIARGVAQLFGYNLLKNFNGPYLAKNPSDFWRRWHISLSQWIRDYIYIPLGGSRGTTFRWAVNLFITFFIVGLWHGASWNYIIWGLYYWILYIIFRIFKTIFKRYNFYKNKYNFLISIPFMFLLTNFGWLIFRETDIHYLLKYLSLNPFSSSVLNFNISVFFFIKTLFYCFPLLIVSLINRNPFFNKFNLNSLPLKIIQMVFLFIGILLFMCTAHNDFIYFQF